MSNTRAVEQHNRELEIEEITKDPNNIRGTK
jgi:hypothetical protein